MVGGVQIEGRSVACLVAADVLARADVPVRVTATEGWGRSFAPMVYDGQFLEIGPRLLELRYDDDEGELAELLDYDGGDHRPWMGHVRTYLEGLIEPRPVELRMERNGRETTDFLLTGDLRFLPAALNAEERRAIEAEVLVISRVYMHGALPEHLDTMSYREASQMLHGRNFHELFIEPLLDAILGYSGDIPALWHRKVWLPLFRPKELLEALWGESHRPQRKMFLGMTEAVRELIRRIQPMRDADLPPGPAVLVDSPSPASLKWLDLGCVWIPAPGEIESVTWFFDGPGEPYRRTKVKGWACLEVGPEHRWTETGTAMRTRVPLESGRNDPKNGEIGAGSFNDQVIAGLAAAAWVLR